jgi:dTDP-4-dehydrorhamnose reductase
MKVLILGSTGLLGSTVAKYFENNKNFDTHLAFRNENVSFGKNKVFFDALNTSLDSLPKADYIINCIGIIKPFMEMDKEKNIYINSLFPHKLSSYCKKNNIKLIHITTDCVFSGKDGNYNENSAHDALDLYGKSKSIGEPDNCMVIRTSIIGEEIHKNASLIEWAKSMRDKEVNGFTNHIWNGVTTKHYAELCEKIINNNLYKEELFHIHSNNVTKYYLLNLISHKFNLKLKINSFQTKEKCDRSLCSNKELNNILKVKTIEQQILEL